MRYGGLLRQQRSQIFALLQKKAGEKEIAQIIGCSTSTVRREINRNSTESGNYLWQKTQEKADSRKARSTANRRLDETLVWRIRQMILDTDWSPEQIAGVLAKDGVMVSVQTIYNIINSAPTGELRKHRRHPWFKRRRKKVKREAGVSNIPNRRSIHCRPEEADGKRFGDFEMDLIVDFHGHAILVLLERMTGFVMLEKLQHGKQAKPVAQAVVRLLFGYRRWMHTITTDNGSEFAAHQDITKGLHMRGVEDVNVYFAAPYCSWQKGAVENVNKLIRQYIPKKSNFNSFSPQFVRKVGHKLNIRPRKKFGFSTPKCEFFKQIAKFALAN